MVLSGLLYPACSAVLKLLFPTVYYSLQWRISFVAFCLLLSLVNIGIASAQTLSNGQIFTNGLAIVDSPQPNSPLAAGEALTLAIDVSGDGALSPAASIPNSGLPYSFNALGVYLISTQSSLNVTVSPPSTLLNLQPGSTVKHLNWQIPACLPSGTYNLTIYECVLVNSIPHFSITPIPVEITNVPKVGNCTIPNNPLQSQPQPSNPPPENPFLPGAPPLSTAPAPSTTNTGRMTTSLNPHGSTGVITVTVGPNGATFPMSVYDNSVTYVLQTATPTARVTVTVSETPMTIVFVSLSTVVETITAPAQTLIETNTVSSLSTTTAVMNIVNSGDFLPANTASIAVVSTLLFTLPLAVTTTIFMI